MHQWLPASTAIVYVFLTAQILHLFCRCSLAGFPLSLGFTFPCYHCFPRLSALQCQQGNINLPLSPSFHRPSRHLQNSPTAVENFDSSGVPKVSSPSDVGSTYPCTRETICTRLVCDHGRLSSADEGSRQCWQSCCLASHYCSQWQIKGG